MIDVDIKWKDDWWWYEMIWQLMMILDYMNKMYDHSSWLLDVFIWSYWPNSEGWRYLPGPGATSINNYFLLF